MLDLMKMDVINFTIQGLRPELQRQSVEYERAKFQSILEKTPSELRNHSNPAVNKQDRVVRVLDSQSEVPSSIP